MFALPGIVALIVLSLVRPQEFVPALTGVPVLHAAVAVTVLGALLDLAIGKVSFRASPVTGWAVALLSWAALTLLLGNPGAFGTEIMTITTAVVLCVAIAQGAQSPRALGVVAGTVLVCSMFLVTVGIHQRLSPKQCLRVNRDEWTPSGGEPDGRGCDSRAECYRTSYQSGIGYLCEHVGVLGTTSIADGRVRYLGRLQDPNELALTLGASLPIAYAFRRRRRSVSSALVALGVTVAVTLCVIFTGSRGGQLVLLAVLGMYFVSLTGVRGVLLAALLALPVLGFGGRADAALTEGSDRIECWAEGLAMFRSKPLHGVGYLQFTEYHDLTAHNAYVLAVAEMGFVGLFLFVGLLYASTKVLLAGLRHYRPGDNDLPRAWAFALLAALGGLMVGSLFLSFSYHPVLWTFVGLCGAYYSVARKSDEAFSFRLGPRDYAAILVICVAMLALIWLIVRFLG